MSCAKKAYLIALLVFAPVVLCAEQYNFRYFGVAEGLTNLAVRQIYQDRVGFLWVATENGVYRFDGERFEAFGPAQGIPMNSGAAFGDGPDGSLLVGGDFGLYRFSENHFQKVPLGAQTVSWAQGIVADGKGHTYIGSDSGLLWLSASNVDGHFDVRRFPQPQGTSGSGAYGIAIDRDVVWFGCGKEVCRLAGGVTTVLGTESGLPQRDWIAIRKDLAGNLWVRGRNAGVFILMAGKTKFQRPNSPVDASTLGGVPLLDDAGRMLFASNAGLVVREQDRWRTINRSKGLRGTVYAAFEDRQHSLWIGLAGHGLARWRGYQQWTSYTIESGLGNDLVYEMLPMPDGSMWLASEGGLFKGVPREPETVTWQKFKGIGDIPVHSVKRDLRGDLWIGTETLGVARIHLSDQTVTWFGEQQGLTGKAAYTLRFGSGGRLWAATEAGLFVSSPPYGTFSRIASLPASRFWAIAEGRDGTVWAGGMGGLFSFSSGTWKNYLPANGLSNREVISLGIGRADEIWIGYRFGGGIDRLRHVSGTVTIEKGIQRNGTDGIVYFLEFDSLGRLWAGTERGVDVWDGARWSHYDTNDGLIWDDCNLNGFAKDGNGTVWIGTSGGLSRFRPRDKNPPVIAPQVVLTKVLLGRTDVTGRSRPSVGIRSNSLAIRFSALNSPRETNVVFRYRLADNNSAWTETTQRELHFAELQPGAYRLELEARDADGDWKGPRAAFDFSVATPWYRSWWFISICGLTPLSVMVFAVRLRMRAARNREDELVRIVDEKTSDLRRANEDLMRLSSLDPLTGLANRRIFDQALAKECGCLHRKDFVVSLLMVDVDHFKALNDSQGHQRGDECLVRVGAELRRLARRQGEVVARYGGEEFAVILPEIGRASAIQFGESIRASIEALELPHPASMVARNLTVSIGVATATHEWRASPEQILAVADDALFRAKRNGRNRLESGRYDVVSGVDFSVNLADCRTLS